MRRPIRKQNQASLEQMFVPWRRMQALPKPAWSRCPMPPRRAMRGVFASGSAKAAPQQRVRMCQFTVSEIVVELVRFPVAVSAVAVTVMVDVTG